jgi:hypothetical protein
MKCDKLAPSMQAVLHRLLRRWHLHRWRRSRALTKKGFRVSASSQLDIARAVIEPKELERLRAYLAGRIGPWGRLPERWSVECDMVACIDDLLDYEHRRDDFVSALQHAEGRLKTQVPLEHQQLIELTHIKAVLCLGENFEVTVRFVEGYVNTPYPGMSYLEDLHGCSWISDHYELIVASPAASTVLSGNLPHRT